MRIAVGNDIVYIPRVAEMTADTIARILRPAEIQRSTPEHIAGLIALKEAAIKACGLAADDWLQIRIRHDAGRPVVELLDSQPDLDSIAGSISHDGDYAFAVVTSLYRES